MKTLSKNAVAVEAIKGFASGSAKSDAGKAGMLKHAVVLAKEYPSTYFAPIDMKEGKVSVNTSGKEEYDNAKLVIAEARLTDNQLRLYKADADSLCKPDRKAKKAAMSRVNKDIGRLYKYIVTEEMKALPKDAQEQIAEASQILKFKEDLVRASKRAEKVLTQEYLNEAKPHMNALLRIASKCENGEIIKLK